MENRQREAENWHWSEEQQRAFETLKEQIVSKVTLAYADFSRPFRLSVDAAREGLGAVLEQEENGSWRPLAFASRKTTDAEKKYPTHKLEFLAFKWAVVERFKDYLCNQKFDVLTDNNPLTYVLTSDKLDAVSQRWVATLADFQFNIRYKCGADNKVADALSRKYDRDSDNTNKWKSWASSIDNEFDIHDNHITPVVANCELTCNEALVCPIIDVGQEDGANGGGSTAVMDGCDWKLLQQSDEHIEQMYNIVLTGEQLAVKQVQELDQPVRKLYKRRNSLVIVDDILYLIDSNQKHIIIVPVAMQNEIAKRYHSFSHYGFEKVKDQLRARYFWEGMLGTIKTVCRNCERCQKAKGQPVDRVPLHHMKVRTGTLQQVSMDFLGIDTRKDTKFKILTVVDDFTKYGWAIEVKSENAKNTAKVLYNRVYATFGFPQIVHSDQGKTFLSKVLKELNVMMQAKQTTSTAFRPQANGGCERFNRTVIDRIRTLEPKKKAKWYEELPSIMLGYNSVIQASTGMSPFYAMFLRSPRIPLDCVYNVPTVDDLGYHDPVSFAETKKSELQQVIGQIKQKTESEQGRNKKAYDAHHTRAVHELSIGDRVLVSKRMPKNKVDDKWEGDIYIVLRWEDKSVPVFLLQSLESGAIKKVHRDHIKRFQETLEDRAVNGFAVTEIPTWENQTVPEGIVESTHEYDQILNAKVSLWHGNPSDLKVDAVVCYLQDDSKLAFQNNVICRQAGPKLYHDYKAQGVLGKGDIRVLEGHN